MLVKFKPKMTIPGRVVKRQTSPGSQNRYKSMLRNVHRQGAPTAENGNRDYF